MAAAVAAPFIMNADVRVTNANTRPYDLSSAISEREERVEREREREERRGSFITLWGGRKEKVGCACMIHEGVYGQQNKKKGRRISLRRCCCRAPGRIKPSATFFFAFFFFFSTPPTWLRRHRRMDIGVRNLAAVLHMKGGVCVLASKVAGAPENQSSFLQ